MPNAVKRQVEAWWYVLLSEREKPKEQQSRFLLKPLTQAERMRVWDDHNWVNVSSDGSSTVSSRGLQQAHALVLTNLLETENFPLDGPRKWPAEGSKTEKLTYLELLDDMDVFEIGNAIREKSTLEPEAKNS
jgi:hypothetical protein